MADAPTGARDLAPVLLFSAFVVATCGLVYELLAGTLASYLLGDSVTQFSTVIGTYLFAMGIGAWLSRYVTANELAVFVRTEILIAAIGGSSAALLFLLFDRVGDFRLPLYGLVLIIGTLVGLEIPLLMRILKDRLEFGDLVSKVLTFDYIGALAASLLFPLVLVPHLGLIRTGFLFGLANVGVALAMLWMLPQASRLRGEMAAGILVAIALVAGLFSAERLQRLAEVAAYQAPIIHAVSTPYQRIVLTRRNDDVRLFLNGNLQFSSRDEYRYHEALVHPALGRIAHPANVLILGGGDGLAAREVLKYPGVRSITLVDLDPAMTRLFTDAPMLAALNGNALRSPKLIIVNADAFVWLRANQRRFGAVIVDFPDPTNFSIGKLYTLSLYRELARAIAPGGIAVVQSTSPLVAPNAYWTVATTLEAAGLTTRGYHAYVPSFGEWGFILAAHGAIADAVALPPGLRFLTPRTAALAFDFPPDMARRPTPVNRLDNQALVRAFDAEWSRVEG
ncbi:polyamine aminopropyltransferase 1 [Polymorphobacter glacialis]|uniref:Polyamine aminopropyltransferase n=1 Tax=Sandarakinorhabdus glacialis TaxID=1614636 RepID=A0A916ZZG9_9SPHN|nr:polyamine aminopropyltransferase [Polymorphobacter glacialis]GGE20085.1 polyamine aminopropyltransferase 1 [Polymorphobacter glacialis]